VSDDQLPCERAMSGGDELDRIIDKFMAGDLKCPAALQIAHAIGFRKGFDLGISEAIDRAASEIVKVGNQHKPEVQS
jgi:hypothetical protein